MPMTLGMIENWGEECFEKVASFGLKAVEFCYNVGNDPEDIIEEADDIKTYVEKYGVKVLSMGRWGSDKFDGDGNIIEEELQGTYMLLDVCEKLGCPVFNTGVNYIEKLSYEENCEKAVMFLQKLVDYGRDKGVKIATYNCDWNNYVREPKAWELVHNQIPELGIKYDPSHCINSGSGDYLGEAAVWGKRFYHFHLKGTLNINGQHLDDPPAGLDMIDWGALIAVLYKHKYQGMLSIEPHSPTWFGELGDWGVKYTIDYISKMICAG